MWDIEVHDTIFPIGGNSRRSSSSTLEAIINQQQVFQNAARAPKCYATLRTLYYNELWLRLRSLKQQQRQEIPCVTLVASRHRHWWQQTYQILQPFEDKQQNKSSSASNLTKQHSIARWARGSCGVLVKSPFVLKFIKTKTNFLGHYQQQLHQGKNSKIQFQIGIDKTTK